MYSESPQRTLPGLASENVNYRVYNIVYNIDVAILAQYKKYLLLLNLVNLLIGRKNYGSALSNMYDIGLLHDWLHPNNRLGNSLFNSLPWP